VSAHFNAESGSNAGSDLHFTRWSDAGVFLGTPLQIRRDNGIVTVESGFTAQGQVLVTAGSGSAGSYKPGLAISGDDDTGVQQVGGANTLSLVTGGSERLRVDASGAVGIGMTPTSLPLSAFSFATSDANVFTTGWGADILCVDTGNFGGILSFRTSATGSATATPTERMRIDASGNVGIGTAGGSNESGFMFHVAGNAFFTSGPNATTKISIDSGDQRLVLGAYYQFGVAAYSFIAATNNAETGDTDLQLRTGTTARMTIASDGKITAAGVYNNTVGGTNRDVFVDSGGLIGYVSSIRESKTDIATLDDVSWLSALAPVSYRYRKKNADGTYSDEADGVTDYGLIAEDVEAVRPELCFYDQVDGEPQLRGVTYSKLITPMLRYIQQLEARIAALEERLNG
jgi:hypothetical protein